MPDDAQAPKSARVLAALARTGGALASAGRAVGEGAAELYRKMDPDVGRHLAQIPLLGYSLLGRRPEPVEALPDDGQPPLVFVHGLGGGRSDFLLMSWRMWLAGRRRSYRIAFAGGHDIEEMAEALAGFVREVRRVNHAGPVDVVAHSLGGVVTRVALHRHRLSRALGTVVTLGSPHQGTHAARFAGTELTRALRPDSALMRDLRTRRWPKSVRGVCFWSENDLMVVPAGSAMLPGAEAVDATPFTHYSYLLDPRGWEAVRRVLGGERLQSV